MRIYYRDMAGKVRKATIKDASTASVLSDLNEQEQWATYISKALQRAVMLPILAVIK